jgi:hypothetical protein
MMAFAIYLSQVWAASDGVVPKEPHPINFKTDSIVIGINKYNRYLNDIESPFKGLVYGPLLIIKLLITRADPTTGIVYSVSYHELAKLLTITPAPGRKDAGTPTKQTIRNWIKSIERECGDYFKVISEGQKLQFFFPEMPKIFKEVFGTSELNTEQSIDKTLDGIKEEGDFTDEVNTHFNTELNTPKDAVKKLFNNINNKTNNNNLGGAIGIKNSKQPISQNFYPSAETISRALASGYHFVTDTEVIQEFIDKNTAWGSEFADYNPVYLSFLSKHTDFQQQRQTKSNGTKSLRSVTHGRTPTKNNSYESVLAEVLRHNGDAIEPTKQSGYRAFNPIDCEFEPTTHFMALDGADQNIWPVISYQARG